MELSERDREILDFEREWWRVPGSKQAAIRERFGMSPASYYRLVSAIIDAPTAPGYDPLTVKRLRHRREQRRRDRIEGRRAHPEPR